MNNELIDIINNSTEKKISDAGKTKKLEFVDSKNNPVPVGIPYHIHITTDKKYWYMTGKNHKNTSILIFKVGGDIPDYVKYRNLVGSRTQEYITEQRTTPNNLDYKRGFITLYFARQSNITDEKVFEISKNDFEKDIPFYSKVSLELKIFGEESEVRLFNIRRINVANSKLRGVEYAVQPLQFYRTNKNTKESVQDRLQSYKQETPSSTSGGSSGGSSGGGGY